MPWWDIVVGGARVVTHGAGVFGEWASTSVGSAYAVLSTLPSECGLASAHAAAVCVGHQPRYYDIPGFGPFTR
eukprot:8470740-Pyramimonas_sp.AAC.1